MAERKSRGTYIVVSERTWAQAREAYLSGCSARVVSARFGIGYDNLRRKVMKEGWTKRANLEAAERSRAAAADLLGQEPTAPVTMDTVRTDFLARALEALHAGRGAEAIALVRATREVMQLALDLARDSARDMASQPSEEQRAAAREAEHRRRLEDSLKLAESMLSPDYYGGLGTRRVLAWRAANLGPEAAERDRAAGRRGGWYDRYWDEAGGLKPGDDLD